MFCKIEKKKGRGLETESRAENLRKKPEAKVA